MPRKHLRHNISAVSRYLVFPRRYQSTRKVTSLILAIRETQKSQKLKEDQQQPQEAPRKAPKSLQCLILQVESRTDSSLDLPVHGPRLMGNLMEDRLERTAGEMDGPIEDLSQRRHSMRNGSQVHRPVAQICMGQRQTKALVPCGSICMRRRSKRESTFCSLWSLKVQRECK